MKKLCVSLTMAALVALPVLAKDAPKKVPEGLPPPPTRADVDRSIKQLKAARDKVDVVQRAKIDKAIADLEAYRRNGLDAEKTLKERNEARKRNKPVGQQPGGKVCPPLKGGIYKPSKVM